MTIIDFYVIFPELKIEKKYKFNSYLFENLSSIQLKWLQSFLLSIGYGNLNDKRGDYAIIYKHWTQFKIDHKLGHPDLYGKHSIQKLLEIYDNRLTNNSE